VWGCALSRARPLLTDGDLAALREMYAAPAPGVEAPDPRLVALLEEHARLRGVLYAARFLVRGIEQGDEECVCGAVAPRHGGMKHGRACPISKLARAARQVARG
jgi:hypothetical protein